MIRFLCVALLLLLGLPLWATHNRAGEITYEQIGPLTIRATITTYTKLSGQSIHADRPTLNLFWGDTGSSEEIDRVDALEVVPDIQRNVYIAEHTYPGANAGQPYIMRMKDPNRNENILNINEGNSVNVEFYIQTEVYLLNSFFGSNSSPILLEPPIDFGVVGQVFQHTPNGYDPDGDSIAYELITPQSDLGTVVPGYETVDLVPQLSPDNQYTFDVHTGLFTWTTPQKEGEYNIAILVKSYRNGLYLGGIVRDIQIEIRSTLNTPPILEAPEEICVWAGELIQFDVTAYDNDLPPQVVTLTATGGPFEILNAAQATFTGPSQGNPVTRTFTWQTECDHIQSQPFQVVFKARDSFYLANGLDASLATFKVLLIRIVAPPPENLQADVASGEVTLSWDAPYICEGAANFQGFSVWRKEFCDGFVPDSCQIGLDGQGYTQLNFGDWVLTPSGGQYTYVDTDVERGALYSYRILGEFQSLTFAESSVTSDEICVQMAQDLPLMTHADVNETSTGTGEVFVQWTRPHPEELDTIQNPPPYRYELFRSEDMAGFNFGFAPIFVSPTYNSFSTALDTFFTDTGLNTEDRANSYRVAFYSSGDTLGYTSIASTIFLTVSATDETNVLSWQENVPWSNSKYVVFEETPVGSDVFTVLDTVTSTSYTHEGLVNGQEYCYYIEGIGGYGISYLNEPFLNKSQVACGTPLDTTPPCPPIGIVNISGCEDVVNSTPMEDLYNTISWANNDLECANDVAKFRVYFAPYCDGNYTLVAESSGLSDTFFLHQPSPTNLAGCYYITAIDSVEVNGGGNESLPSGIVETENCPFYELPNVFTPNGDDRNELFTPFMPYRYVEEVDFKVHNRWGQLLFDSEKADPPNHPDIGWDGRDQNTGKIVPEGVYYYTALVQENRLTPTGPLRLCGYIHVIRGNSN